MRKPRIVVPGYPHHVILRGNNRRRLFSYPSDYRAFLRYLAGGLRKHPCEVNALALMTNHVHLLMTPRKLETLPKLIHYTSMRYAQLRNARHADSGKLFEGKFLSFPVLGERQLAIVTA